ncbi:MAG: hypothetical protein IKB71_02035 [Lentisphaeria bacterium]|nr:hypothetical protein [Lentisphaeria bacterium]
MKKIRQLKFTLMEVTVAFGIFAILVAVLMQFLNTAQRSWNLAEKRARAYADSRILFDLMDKALNTSHTENFSLAQHTYSSDNYSYDEFSFNGILPYRFPFHATASPPTSSRNINRVVNGSSVSIPINTFLDENIRKVRVLELNLIAPPATPTATPATDHGTIGIEYNNLNGNLLRDVILDNVIEFNVQMLSNNFSAVSIGSNLPRPAFVIVRLRMFGSDEDYAVWRTLPLSGAAVNRNDYFREHGFTFTRMFTLPRGQ